MFRRTAISLLVLAVVIGTMGAAAYANPNPTPTVSGEFPIGIFVEPASATATNAMYEEIREMNANLIVASTNTTPAATDWMLDLAAANDLKVLVTDTGIRWYQSEWIAQNEADGTDLFIRDDRPIGQTFTTGPGPMDAPYKISFKKSGAWPAGKSATLSIYDSVAKTNLIASNTISGPIISDYPEFTILGVYVSPNTTYYMELTTDSTTDLGFFKTSSSDAYAGGQAYVNGTPQPGDLYFQITLTTYGGIHDAFTPTSRPSEGYLETFVDHYKSHPALQGYNLVDEPFGHKFDMLEEATDKIRTLDPDHMVYTNLYGVCDDCQHYYDGTNDPVRGGYEDYVNGWLDTDPDMISFDIYPYLSTGFTEEPYYQSLEYYRQQSLLYDTDLWAYIQSMSYDTFNMVEPSESELKFQIYSTLAYGAKGYVYFTYHAPAGFDNALILSDGTRNDTYGYAQAVNGEVLQLGDTLLSLTSKDVYHTGGVPPFARALPSSYFWQPTAGQPEMPMIVSRFENTGGRQFVMIVNKDLDNAHTASFTLSGGTAAVTEVSKTTGLEIATNFNAGTGIFTADFAAGEGRLFALDDEPAAAEAYTTLTGSESAVPGKKFTVTYGLGGVTGNVHAQDVKLDYDAGLMEFVSANSVRPGVKVVRTVKSTPGRLRLVLASEGPDQAVTGDTELVELTFRAKEGTQNATGTIAVTEAVLGDAQGNESEAAVASLAVTISNLGDLNSDGAVSIGDLAIASVHFGKSIGSPEWQQIRSADLNGDGTIDLADLVELSKKI